MSALLPRILLLHVVLACTSCASCASSHALRVLPCRILDVPALEQIDNHCGPAVLAATYQFWGRNEDQNSVAERVYEPKQQGTLNLMLVADARREGFNAAFRQANKDLIISALDNGIPVIALVRHFWRYHFEIISGYGFAGDELMLLVNEGKGKYEWKSYDRLDRAHRRAKRFTVFIWPKEKAFDIPPLPKTMDEE